MPRFALGRVVATPAALEALREAIESPQAYLSRHAKGDWGDVDGSDRKANEQAIRTGARILSSYKTRLGEKIWVITEAEGDDGARASTCILLPSDY